MEKVVFTDGWDEYFAARGMQEFADFYDYSAGGVLVNKNSKRNVQRLVFEGDGGGAFYMKRFERPHLKDTYFAFRNYGKVMSQAQLEWENARLLLANGIDTYKPACYGHRIACGLERMSFFITEELAGQCLTDFVAGSWSELEQAQKEQIIKEIGAFVWRIHKAKVRMPDLYVWHIFLTEKTEERGGDKYEFAVIDLHRMSHNITNNRSRIEDLGRLHHSMRAEYFSEDLKRLLVESYARAAEINNATELVAKVEKKSQAVSAKRKVLSY